MSSDELKGSGLDRRTIEPGTVILKEGEPGDEAYFVESGKIEVFCSPGGNKIVIGVLGPGSILGEMAMIDAAPRMASAVALEKATLRVIPRAAIEREIKKSDPFVRAMLVTLVQNVRMLSAQTIGIHMSKPGGPA
jgi:CRP-like cAMP-binding protein